VEVKGTQTKGRAIILTRGEVEHIREHFQNSILVIVHSLNVDKKLNISGGGVRVIEQVHLHQEDLLALQYQWTVERN
jgi:hypothetical protein